VRSAVTAQAWSEHACHAEALDAAIAELFGERDAQDGAQITLTLGVPQSLSSDNGTLPQTCSGVEACATSCRVRVFVDLPQANHVKT
jgi:hypothetical protein